MELIFEEVFIHNFYNLLSYSKNLLYISRRVNFIHLALLFKTNFSLNHRKPLRMCTFSIVRSFSSDHLSYTSRSHGCSKKDSLFVHWHFGTQSFEGSFRWFLKTWLHRWKVLGSLRSRSINGMWSCALISKQNIAHSYLKAKYLFNIVFLIVNSLPHYRLPCPIIGFLMPA